MDLVDGGRPVDPRPYCARIVSILATPVSRLVLQDEALLISREGDLSVFYAPVDAFNPQARVVLVGLTPGWQQMRLAIDAYQAARARRLSNVKAQAAAKAAASFAGMRTRIISWLDDIGVAAWLGIETSEALFPASTLLHTTSLIRYPVFVGAMLENYRGIQPRAEDSPQLRRLIHELLVPELASLPDALVVPMGTAVSRALACCQVVEARRCLFGFPHPSGANGWGPRQFTANRAAMTTKVKALAAPR